MLDLDLTDTFGKGLQKKLYDSRRGDHRQAHVSHLGKCLLQTHLSRVHAEKVELTARGAQLILQDLRDKEYIIDVLAAGLKKNNSDHGWQIFRSDASDGSSDFAGQIDVEITRALCEHALFAEYDSATGWSCRHATHDPRQCEVYDIERGLISVKTDMRPVPSPDVSDVHRMEALGYAVRHDIRWYSVFQWDRALHGFVQYPAPGEWFDATNELWLSRHYMETHYVTAWTGNNSDPLDAGIVKIAKKGKLVGNPPEQNEKGKSRHCVSCVYAQCAKNANPNAVDPGTF